MNPADHARGYLRADYERLASSLIGERDALALELATTLERQREAADRESSVLQRHLGSMVIAAQEVIRDLEVANERTVRSIEQAAEAEVTRITAETHARLLELRDVASQLRLLGGRPATVVDITQGREVEGDAGADLDSDNSTVAV